MANATGLPMVVAAGPELDAIDDGRVAILDAGVGQLIVDPGALKLRTLASVGARPRDP
jgi:phosphoenolpyruvate-protein kinase (PTS system EI component)